MEEINLLDILKYIKSKILVIVLMAVLSLLVGLIYKIGVEKPIYKSNTTLILVGFSNSDNTKNSIDTTELTINQRLVTTYQQIAKSREVLNKVIKDLNLKYSVEYLANNITVTGVDNTEIIRISVSDNNAKKAYYIANKLSEVFTEKVTDTYNISNISILDRPTVAKNSSNMRIGKFSILCLFAGFGIGVLAIVIMYYFDTTIKTSEQIENKFDIPVLGSVPNYEENKKKRGDK